MRRSFLLRLTLASTLAAAAAIAPVVGAAGTAPSTAAALTPAPPRLPAEAVTAATPSIAQTSAPTAVAPTPAPSPTSAPHAANPPAPRALGPAFGGLYAHVNRYSNSGPYGAPLVNGCTWATWISQCQNVTVYGNGTSFGNVGCGPPNGCTFGPEFQCTELVQRYAHYAFGEPATWYAYGGGDAYTFWNAAPALPVPLQRFSNGGGVPPRQGDILVFAAGWLGSYWDAPGHVAVVRDVGPGYLDLVQQNGTPSGTDRLALNGSTVNTGGGYTPLIGWLRYTQQVPVPLPVSNVAGVPQTVSDQAGDIDVAWRGTDNRLWTISYRNGNWQAQATAISPANVAGDPSIVSSGAGRLDVFWSGTDGNLWHVGAKSGLYGAATWFGAENLGQGPLLSPPHAASPASGKLDVFWKGPDGTLYGDRYDAGWSGGMPLRTGLLAGPPAAVAIGGGMVDVAWRDPNGALWSDTSASFGWLPPEQVAGGLASDPTLTSAAPGGVDVFWRSTGGQVWQAERAPAGVWSTAIVVTSQPTAGLPAPVSSGPGSITVLLQLQNANLAAALYSSGAGWVGPELLGDGPVGSMPSVVMFGGGGIDAFWRGQNNGLWYSPACAGCAATPPTVISGR